MNLTPATHSHLAAILAAAENASKTISKNGRDSIHSLAAIIEFSKTLRKFNTDKSVPKEDRKATRDFRKTAMEIVANAHIKAIVSLRK